MSIWFLNKNKLIRKFSVSEIENIIDLVETYRLKPKSDTYSDLDEIEVYSNGAVKIVLKYTHNTHTIFL